MHRTVRKFLHKLRDRRTLKRATKLRRRSAKGRTRFQRSLRRR